MKEGWKYRKLGEVCKIYNGNSINANFKKNNYEGLQEGYPFIATKDVSFLGKIDYDNGVRIPFDNDLKRAYADSVFICAEGGSAGRKIALVEQEVCFGNKLFCLQPKENNLLGKYLFYYLNSNTFQMQFKERLTGLIGGVSAKKFNDIDIFFPSLPEQQRIVSRLDASFAKIDALSKQAEEALEHAKALFQAKLKELMEKKEGWEEKKLKDIGLTQTGTTPSKADKTNYGDYIPFIRPSEIDCDSMGNIEYNSELMLSEQGVSKGRLFKKHSILMVCIGATIGKVGFCTKDVSCNQQINVLTPKDQYNYKYIYYAMLSPIFRNEVIKQGTSAQATLPIINKGKWEQLTIPIPPLSEQQQIVQTLDSLSQKIKQLQQNYNQTLANCQALKQALLKETFE